MGSDIETLVDRLVSVQEKLQPRLRDEGGEFLDNEFPQEGRHAVLNILKPDGDEVHFRLKFLPDGSLIRAPEDTDPSHEFVVTEDAFLDILLGRTTAREAFTQNKLRVQDHETGKPDLAEMHRFSSGFEHMENTLTYIRRHVLD